MHDSPAPSTHPRPQLTRSRWQDLCGHWQFAYDDGDVGLRERWPERNDVFDRAIVVPFPPESTASGVGDRSYHPVLWYRRTFRAEHADGERLLLHFGAVDYRASAWVNGHLVAEHEGGHTPFSADVTEALVRGDDAEQVLVVRAEDDPRDFEQPRGKQDWEHHPHAIWYHRTTGIWQPVWLEPVPATRIRELRWTPDLDLDRVRLDVRLHGTDRRALRLRVVLTLRGEMLADQTLAVRGDRVPVEIILSRADLTLGHRDVLWSPDSPNLIDARIELLDGAEIVDEVSSYTALRTVSASGGRIALNGRPYFLRLVLAQGYWPRSHLAATDEDLRCEAQWVRDLGFNGMRVHQRIADPRFLHWCDRIGLLVWAEMPAAYEFSPRTVERVTREWLEVLHRDYSHPCIVAWVPMNESWGVPALERSAEQRDFVRALYHLTKALDPTRLVIGNDGWEQVVTDVVTVHDYSARPEVLRERYGDHPAVDDTLRHTQPGYRALLLPGTQHNDEPVMVTEFGGITYQTGDEESWRGYGAVNDREQLLERYRSLVDALLDSPTIAGFCYTQLADTVQERNGLLTEDREPKLDPAVVRRITRRPAAAVPADAIGSFEYGDYPPTVMTPPLDRNR